MKKFILGLCLTPFLFTACEKDVVPDYDIRDEYVGDYQVNDACDASMNDYNIRQAASDSKVCNNL